MSDTLTKEQLAALIADAVPVRMELSKMHALATILVLQVGLRHPGVLDMDAARYVRQVTQALTGVLLEDHPDLADFLNTGGACS